MSIHGRRLHLIFLNIDDCGGRRNGATDLSNLRECKFLRHFKSSFFQQNERLLRGDGLLREVIAYRFRLWG